MAEPKKATMRAGGPVEAPPPTFGEELVAFWDAALEYERTFKQDAFSAEDAERIHDLLTSSRGRMVRHADAALGLLVKALG